MLSELCVKRPVFATMLVLSLVVLGIFSFRDLGVDLFPRADPATVNVSLSLPGASPDEMTTAVIMPMENALSGIGGIDQMTSTASDGSAGITIRFVLERDLEDAANSVREKVAGAMRNVPPQVLPPIIQKADPDAAPIMSLVLSSTEAMSLRTLTEITDKQVKRQLESVDGVGEVTMSGDLPREIHVVIDIEKLNAHGLSMDQVRDAIQAENVEIPGGTLEQGEWQVGLRTLGRIDATDQFKNIIIKVVNGTPIRVSDVGYAEDTTQRQTSAQFMGNGNPAIQLDIRRASGENTIKVTDAVKRKLKSIRPTLPKTVQMALISDDSEFINASVESLEEHLIWGSLLASLIVVFFIRNIRAVFISALAIPASIVATFTLMRVMNFTLNNMTLLGLTLAVGIVIDDAIVVLENIFRYIEEKHCSPYEAAIEATREVALPVMATTLSLVVIFLPVAFMTGYAARFIDPFGWTMAFSIIVSMGVSFTLTPMLSSRFLKAADAANDEKTKDSRFFRAVDRWYTSSLMWSFAHPGIIIGTSVVVVALTVPLNRVIGRTFVPDEDMGQITIHADTPQGTSLEGTADIARSVVKDLSGQEGVGQLQYVAGSGKVNHFHVYVYLKPLGERTSTQEDVITRMRAILAHHPGLAPIVAGKTPLGGGEANFAIQASLLGPDMDKLYDYSQQLLARAQQTPSMVDPKTSYSNASPEIHVAVDRARAADLGVRMATVGNLLRLMVAGDDEISTYREGSEQYPVKMRVLEDQRRDVETIGKLTVPSSTVGSIRLDNIARFERGFGPTQIRRVNRQFSIDLQADVAPGHALDEASNDVRRLIADLHMPAGYGSRLSGQTQILDETTGNLIMAIGLASIFVYMVLAAQFESFVQPIIIMLVLPVSVPFALFTIWVTGRTLNLWSALGILLLFGIVKKNSILQVDYANVLRARGLGVQDAVLEACRTRLRPILMTTSAIIAGLIPTALGLGIGGAQRATIAITIIGGQSLCLFLTLLLVPVAYVKFAWLEESFANQQLKQWMGRVRGRFSKPRPAHETNL
jgi:HAE1 family hydrophobic/amphiphilic exporter-1